MKQRKELTFFEKQEISNQLAEKDASNALIKKFKHQLEELKIIEDQVKSVQNASSEFNLPGN